ncbi:MAG: DUF721 domain-containing protein [Inquilinus sp.]|nr:DUF721 domain-containing protein [Inquilinus sp.]
MSRPKSLSALASPIARAALGKRFAALGALLEEWPHIVGPALADRTLPEKLDFPRGQRDGGVLHLRVAPADALEIQHDTPRILERLNGHFGYRAVERLRLVQAPPTPRRPAKRRRPGPPIDTEELAAAVDCVDDPELRERLARLGRALSSRF